MEENVNTVKRVNGKFDEIMEKASKQEPKMTNVVMEKYEIPEPWMHMMIKSTHKKGEKEDLNNKRGLFLTNSF